MPIVIPDIPFIGKKRKPVAPMPIATGPVLIAAEYASGQALLTFDRDVNIDAFDGSQLGIADGPDSVQFVGDSAELADPASVLVVLINDGSASGVAVLLTATGTTGIVAAEDGESWAGVTDVELPFS